MPSPPPKRHTRKRKHTRHQTNTKDESCGTLANFYRRVHGRWLAHTRIPATETRLMHAYTIRKQIDAELDVVLCAQKEGPLADLRAVWSAADPLKELTPLLMMMLATEGSRDISECIGWMNRYGVGGCPIHVYVDSDARDRERCRVVIEEGEPRIGSPEYWLWPNYAGHRKAYATYVRRLAQITGIPALLKGYRAEAEFAAALPNEGRGRRKQRHMLSWSELRTTYTTIDWAALLVAWGLREDELATYTYDIRTAGPFLHRMQSRMRSWSAERWQGWFALLLTQWVAGLSPHGPLRAAWFAYTMRYRYGAEADVSAAELEREVMRLLMPSRLGALWVRKYCSDRLKRDVESICERVRQAAIDQVRGTAWLAASTREVAVYKLQRLSIEVGWPDAWAHLEVPTLHAKMTLVEALQTLAGAVTDRDLALLRSGDCSSPTGDGWGSPVFDVNAFYYPAENRFLLPAGILRAPFYDPRKSAVWNYGAIGATIGHELCHAFDAEGRNFDADGNQRNWWTAGDRREYDARAKRMIDLYESEDYRGLAVNGRLTLVENIADIGGLEFALAGAKKAAGRALTRTELREFFYAFAYSWRAKDRIHTAAERLATNTHAPPQIRVNHTLRQIDEWYEVYDVSADCPAFIAPAKRIRFFR